MKVLSSLHNPRLDWHLMEFKTASCVSFMLELNAAWLSRTSCLKLRKPSFAIATHFALIDFGGNHADVRGREGKGIDNVNYEEDHILVVEGMRWSLD